MFFDVLWRADDQIAITVAGRVLPQASQLTGPQLRRKLRRELFKADPDGYAQRTRKAVETRSVGMTADPGGTASLFGCNLPADRAAAAFERVDALARVPRPPVTSATSTNSAPTCFSTCSTAEVAAVHRRGVIDLVVPWETAVGLAQSPVTWPDTVPFRPGSCGRSSRRSPNPMTGRNRAWCGSSASSAPTVSCYGTVATAVVPRAWRGSERVARAGSVIRCRSRRSRSIRAGDDPGPR